MDENEQQNTQTAEEKGEEEHNSDEIPLSAIIPTFTCPICGDLFVDAHTLKDCLHSCLY